MRATASQQFIDLFKRRNGQRLWETRTTFEGEKVTLECWLVNSVEVMLLRWKDGQCSIYKQFGVGCNSLSDAINLLDSEITNASSTKV